MLKYLLALVLVGTRSVIYSAEEEESYRTSLNSQDESVAFIAEGSLNLFCNEPYSALENFQKALTLSSQSEDLSATEFLVLFGQVIAYDMLGLKGSCGEAANSLLFSMQNCAAESDEAEVSQDFLSEIEDLETFEMLRGLASIAPTPEVREFLFSLIDEISEEEVFTFKLADQPFLSVADWEFDYGQDASLEECKKSWIKRSWKKIRNRLQDVKDVLQSAVEIKELVRELFN